jgi:F-type H+-transporting ATPase subunit delta
MAELATIARPYAEALSKAGGATADMAQQVSALAAVAADGRLRQYASHPKVEAAQVYELMTSVLRTPLSTQVGHFLRAVLDNGRLDALPEIAAQYHALVNAKSGISDATIYSAFPIAGAQLDEVVATLERRFARKLNASVVVQSELIGGIRVVVGDEVLDTSVKARLEQMRVALVA